MQVTSPSQRPVDAHVMAIPDSPRLINPSLHLYVIMVPFEKDLADDSTTPFPTFGGAPHFWTATGSFFFSDDLSNILRAGFGYVPTFLVEYDCKRNKQQY